MNKKALGLIVSLAVILGGLIWVKEYGKKRLELKPEEKTEVNQTQTQKQEEIKPEEVKQEVKNGELDKELDAVDKELNSIDTNDIGVQEPSVNLNF